MEAAEALEAEWRRKRRALVRLVLCVAAQVVRAEEELRRWSDTHLPLLLRCLGEQAHGGAPAGGQEEAAAAAAAAEEEEEEESCREFLRAVCADPLLFQREPAREASYVLVVQLEEETDKCARVVRRALPLRSPMPSGEEMDWGEEEVLDRLRALLRAFVEAGVYDARARTTLKIVCRLLFHPATLARAPQPKQCWDRYAAAAAAAPVVSTDAHHQHQQHHHYTAQTSWAALVGHEEQVLALENSSYITATERDEPGLVSTGRFWKVGAAALGGGALLFYSGGLAAPSIVASTLALCTAGSTLAQFGTAISTFLASWGLTGTSLLTGSFGATGASLAGYKMSKRTNGIHEFHFLHLQGPTVDDDADGDDHADGEEPHTTGGVTLIGRNTKNEGLPVFVLVPGWFDGRTDPRDVWGGNSPVFKTDDPSELHLGEVGDDDDLEASIGSMEETSAFPCDTLGDGAAVPPPPPTHTPEDTRAARSMAASDEDSRLLADNTELLASIIDQEDEDGDATAAAATADAAVPRPEERPRTSSASLCVEDTDLAESIVLDEDDGQLWRSTLEGDDQGAGAEAEGGDGKATEPDAAALSSPPQQQLHSQPPLGSSWGSADYVPGQGWWREVVPSGEEYVLVWESQVMQKWHHAMSNVLSHSLRDEAIRLGIEELIKQSVLSTLASAAAWPIKLLEFASSLDNPMATAMEKSCLAGKMLARVLMRKPHGNRPVQLVGFSLGARVIFHCLAELDRVQAYGLIENAVLLGAPVSTNTERWRAARRVVSNRLINGYSSNDWFLSFLYRKSSWELGVAGLQPIPDLEDRTADDTERYHHHHHHHHSHSRSGSNKDAAARHAAPVSANLTRGPVDIAHMLANVENVDLTDLVRGHLTYANVLPQILQRIEIEN